MMCEQPSNVEYESTLVLVDFPEAEKWEHLAIFSKIIRDVAGLDGFKFSQWRTQILYKARDKETSIDVPQHNYVITNDVYHFAYNFNRKFTIIVFYIITEKRGTNRFNVVASEYTHRVVVRVKEKGGRSLTFRGTPWNTPLKELYRIIEFIQEDEK